ncbi:hypothetical protein NQ176_g1771 [Zarea fungicola]|uniref:Uncharacterized protein n=1 Tax=Zarea fungicola TaxID=93591 RepID=A0ACC1NSF8_9HYPO|nr:hypothetical protein NQ176_g1771 [Lecanicillium fungicola]
MLLSLSTVKALGLASVLAFGTASPVGLPEHGEPVSDLDRRILGNDAQSLLCITPGDRKCGLWVSYTNGQTRQSVKYESGGTTACAFNLLRKHTNNAGFWANLNFLGSAGMNIGYNPTGSSIALGKATWSVNGQAHLNARCLNEFGWKDNVDTSKSSETFWGNLGKKLY